MGDDVTLKELVQAQTKAIEATFLARLHSMQIAVDKAERVLDVRLESMNEFRTAMKDQAGGFATKEQANRLEERLRSLENHRAYTLGIAAIIAILISVLLKIFG